MRPRLLHLLGVLLVAAGCISRPDPVVPAPDWRSADFAKPPAAVLPGVGGMRGTLRASISAVGEQVCRPYVRTYGS